MKANTPKPATNAAPAATELYAEAHASGWACSKPPPDAAAVEPFRFLGIPE